MTDHSDDFVSRLSERLGGRAVFKRLLITTLLFFALFAIIAATKFIHDLKSSKAEQIAQFETSLLSDAGAVERALNAEIKWIDLSLSQRGSAQQVVTSVTRSNNVVAAAIINGNSHVLADTRGVGPQLAALDRRNFPANGVTVDSLINDQGIATPVVTRKSGDSYLVVALAPGTLVGQQIATRALVRDTGRVIDGPPRNCLARTSIFLQNFRQSLGKCYSRFRSDHCQTLRSR